MAQLLIQHNDLIVRLSAWEKLRACRPHDVRIPRASVTSARVTATPWAELRGRRAPGTGLRRVIALGVPLGRVGRDFAVVYRNGPGIVIECTNAEFARLVLTIDEPETVASALNAGTSPT